MYFLILFVICWSYFLWRADKSRIREIYGAMIYTSLLGLLTDLIMVKYQLWTYEGLPQPHFTIPLTLDFGIYPVVAYFYVSSLPESWPSIFLRALAWMAPALFFEWMTLRLGKMHHHQWWTLWLSMISDILIYMSIAAVYRYYHPAYIKAQTEGTPSR